MKKKVKRSRTRKVVRKTARRIRSSSNDWQTRIIIYGSLAILIYGTLVLYTMINK